MRIVLTGYRGTGKTAVGSALARRLGLPFIDTDIVIEERAGLQIHEIFTLSGEERFREMERQVISSLPERDAVISTGGGAVMDPRNTVHLRKGSTVFLLTAPVETIVKRIGGTARPSLTGLPIREEVEQLLRKRREAYCAAADFFIPSVEEPVDAVCDRIAEVLHYGSITSAARNSAAAFITGTGISPEDKEAFVRHLAGKSAGPGTKFFGIAGNPCTHSKSPPLFNSLFARYGLNAFYTRFQWHDIGEIIAQARAIDAKGLSVTIPFKEPVMAHLDEIDPVAEAIGAVNTVVFCGGMAIGHNTDWLGIRGPLAHRAGARAVILGAGGAAAAAAYALKDLDMKVTVLARTPEKGRRLAARFGCGIAPFDQFSEIDPDVVVNATPVGMHPDTRSPVPVTLLRKGMTVFDLVYTPEETPLIQGARRAGSEVITGMSMFVRQAAAQLRFFTGIEAPPEFLRSIIP